MTGFGEEARREIQLRISIDSRLFGGFDLLLLSACDGLEPCRRGLLRNRIGVIFLFSFSLVANGGTAPGAAGLVKVNCLPVPGKMGKKDQ